MLSNSELYRIWRQRLLQLTPVDLSHQTYRLSNFFWLLIGIYQAGHVALGIVSRYIPIRVQKLSLQRRFRRFLDNEAICVRDWYATTMKQLLDSAAQSGRIRLIIDCTHVGTTHLLLMVAVAYRRRALPVAWSWVSIPNGNGRSSESAQLRLLRYINRHIHPLTYVSLVGDTEFGGGKLIRWLQKQGWHFALHQRETTYLFPPSGTYCQFRDAPIKPGQQIWLEKVILNKKSPFKCNALIYQESSHSEAWFIATNFATAVLAAQHYKQRMWIEELFGDFKRHGFHLWHSRLATAARLDRLTLIVCLLYVWLIAIGQRVIQGCNQAEIDRTDRRDLSLFRLGWDWVERRSVFGDPLPDVFVPTLHAKVSGS